MLSALMIYRKHKKTILAWK